MQPLKQHSRAVDPTTTATITLTRPEIQGQLKELRRRGKAPSLPDRFRSAVALP